MTVGNEMAVGNKTARAGAVYIICVGRRKGVAKHCGSGHGMGLRREIRCTDGDSSLWSMYPSSDGGVSSRL